MQTYCLVCKKATDNVNSRVAKTKDRLQMKSICTICGNRKSRFMSQGFGLFDILGLKPQKIKEKKQYGEDLKTFRL